MMSVTLLWKSAGWRLSMSWARSVMSRDRRAVWSSGCRSLLSSSTRSLHVGSPAGGHSRPEEERDRALLGALDERLVLGRHPRGVAALVLGRRIDGGFGSHQSDVEGEGLLKVQLTLRVWWFRPLSSASRSSQARPSP